MTIYRFTIFSKFGAYGWRNYHHIETADPGDENAIGNALGSFHRNMLPTFCSVSRVTWNEMTLTGLGPIHTTTFTGAGFLAGSAIDYLPAGNVAWVNKRPVEGNPGRLPLRFALLKADIVADGQDQTYNPTGDFLEAFNDAEGILSLALAGIGAEMLIGTGFGAFHVSPQLTEGVPGYLDPDKGWYNVTTPEP